MTTEPFLEGALDGAFEDAFGLESFDCSLSLDVGCLGGAELLLIARSMSLPADGTVAITVSAGSMPVSFSPPCLQRRTITSMVPTFFDQFRDAFGSLSAIPTQSQCAAERQRSSGLTSLQRREEPISRHEATIRRLLLFLAEFEIDLVLHGIHSIPWHFKAKSISIALVFTIDEDVRRKTWRNVSAGGDAHVERNVRLRREDEALDGAVSEAMIVLLEARVARAELDASRDLLEGGHAGGSVRSYLFEAMKSAHDSRTVSDTSVQSKARMVVA